MRKNMFWKVHVFLGRSWNSLRVDGKIILICKRFSFYCLFAGFHAKQQVLKSACFSGRSITSLRIVVKTIEVSMRKNMFWKVNVCLRRSWNPLRMGLNTLLISMRFRFDRLFRDVHAKNMFLKVHVVLGLSWSWLRIGFKAIWIFISLGFDLFFKGLSKAFWGFLKGL